jgi:hypothetical protein
MPITPYLRGQAFDPETIQVMGVAFESTCKALGLRETTDPITTFVARTVIEMAQRGIKGADRLTDAVLKKIEWEYASGQGSGQDSGQGPGQEMGNAGWRR